MSLWCIPYPIVADSVLFESNRISVTSLSIIPPRVCCRRRALIIFAQPRPNSSTSQRTRIYDVHSDKSWAPINPTIRALPVTHFDAPKANETSTSSYVEWNKCENETIFDAGCCISYSGKNFFVFCRRKMGLSLVQKW
jgi:hypothetical protein